jgi:hypothetical protein
MLKRVLYERTIFPKIPARRCILDAIQCSWRATETEKALSSQGSPANQEMSFGVLALASEREGVLFVDDQRAESISAGKKLGQKCRIVSSR